MQNIQNNPWVKKSLEGLALFVALVGLFYLGQAVAEIKFMANESIPVQQDRTAALLQATQPYEYVLIDRSQGLKIKR